ncbi:MAG: DUF3641 domain-containing protein [Deltaproteobacteria bacterium]|nr:DUF3641 domain-containing protein [Deltaproteobacteria bacterium]
MVPVSWDGYLYDCDFSMAKGVPMDKRKTHVSEMSGPPLEGSPIFLRSWLYVHSGRGFYLRRHPPVPEFRPRGEIKWMN